MTRSAGFPHERRHTLLFLRLAAQQAAILMDTEVDMTEVVRDRTRAPDAARPAYVSYVVHGAGRALAAHPDANAAVHGRLVPRIARYEQVVAKVAFDKHVNGVRAIVSGLVPDADRAGLGEIDERIGYYKDCDAASAPELAGMRALHRLPWPFAAAGFRIATRSLRRRPELLGTFSVSSLGHRAVGSFYPLGGTAVSIGVGQIRELPVVRNGDIVTAPVMRLGLVFDHRVIDGALAADLLTDLKSRLEAWGTTPTPTPATAGAAA